MELGFPPSPSWAGFGSRSFPSTGFQGNALQPFWGGNAMQENFQEQTIIQCHLAMQPF